MQKDKKEGVKNNNSIQKSHQLKTFVRVESDCKLRLGLSFSMKNHFIPEAVKLVFAFLETLKLFPRLFGTKQCFSRKSLPIDEEEFMCQHVNASAGK